MITFKRVPPKNRLDAHQWHSDFAAGDDHIFPRTIEQYGALVLEGAVWCAVTDSDDYCAMAYYAPDDDAWELGGLMVDESQRGRSVGSTLMRLALGTVLTELDPLKSGEKVITHVHAENDKPRNLIEHVLKFKYLKPIKIHGSKLPGLKTDDDGYVNGDVFELTFPDSIEVLAEWCEGWSNELGDGTPAVIKLPLGQTLDEWASDFREMIDENSS